MAYGNGEIFLLPFESLLTQLFPVDPEGALSFYDLYNFADGLIRSQGNQAMHMVCISIDTVHKNVFAFCILPDMLKNHFPYRFLHERSPVLRGPHEVKPGFDVWHKDLFG